MGTQLMMWATIGVVFASLTARPLIEATAGEQEHCVTP
jgi:hypothetical protein